MNSDILRSAVHRVPHAATMRAFHCWFMAQRLPRYEYARLAHGLPRLHRDVLAGISGDDLFILGSGSSLNEISSERWEAIQSKRVFGFNFSMCLDIVPDLYAFEDAGTFTPVYKKLVELARERPEYRSTVKIFANTSERTPKNLPPFSDDDFWSEMPPWMKENCYSAMAIGTFARDERESKESLTYLRENGYFDPENPSRVFKYRGTLSMMITLGIMAGFRRICPCGIDLNNSAYFYEDESRFPDMAGFRSSKAFSKHATERELRGAASMSDVVVALRDVVARPVGCEIYVETEASGLYPRIETAPSDMFEMS